MLPDLCSRRAHLQVGGAASPLLALFEYRRKWLCHKDNHQLIQAQLGNLGALARKKHLLLPLLICKVEFSARLHLSPGSPLCSGGPAPLPLCSQCSWQVFEQHRAPGSEHAAHRGD